MIIGGNMNKLINLAIAMPSNPITNSEEFSSINRLLTDSKETMVYIGVGIAVIMLLAVAIKFMMSKGHDSENEIKNVKKVIFALIGILSVTGVVSIIATYMG